MLGSSGGNCMEDFFVIAGNLAVQTCYGLYVVFLHGVFATGLNPLFLIVFGNLVSSFTLLPFVLVFERKKWPARFSLSLFFRIFLISLGGAFLFQALTLSGVKKASPAVATAMPNLVPGFIFIIAACLRLEKFDLRSSYSRAKVMGTLMCLGGALTMCFSQTPSSEERMPALNEASFFLSDRVQGLLCLLAGAFLLSCSTVLQASTMIEFPAPLSLVAASSVMGSGLTALYQLITEGGVGAGSSTLSLASIARIVLLGGALISVCVGFQNWCMIKRGPVLVTIFSPVQTVTALVFSAWLSGEFIYLGSLAGIVLLFTGLYLFLWAKTREDIISLRAGAATEAESGTSSRLPVEDIEKPLLS